MKKKVAHSPGFSLMAFHVYSLPATGFQSRIVNADLSIISAKINSGSICKKEESNKKGYNYFSKAKLNSAL